MNSKPRETLRRLISLFSIEEKARNCRSRKEAQRCIRRADETKQALWGSTEVTMDGHF